MVQKILLVLLLVVVQVLSTPSEGPPPRPLFRPRQRSPIHFKAGNDNIRKTIEDKLTGKLPPITDVTSSEEGKAKPRVRIFNIGTPTTTSRSLLDDTEPLDLDDIGPTNAAENESEGNDHSSNGGDEEDKNELEGQETFYGGVFGVVTPTVAVAPPPVYSRLPYSSVAGRYRPTVGSTMVGSGLLAGSGTAVTVPISPNPPTGPPTVVPVLGVGPSPSITTIQMPAPPPGSTGTRSLFSSGRAAGFGRRPLNRDNVKGPSFTPTVSSGSIRTSNEPSDIITDFFYSDIKCYRTKQKEYFGAKIHLKNGFHVPYIRDRPDDPLTSSECQLESLRDSSTYQLKMTDLRTCGVEQCGEAMCLTMVFPRMPTLALADDEVTTIKCSPQKSSMAEMKTISFAGDSIDKRRSGSTVEGGGQEFAAEVGVFRQNPGTPNGLFVKRVNSGGVVQLGESLQLRSVVRGGDGWTFSKLTDVKVWRMRDSYSHVVTPGRVLNPGEASEVITLVDERGCRNDEYRVIADLNPLRDPRNDLVHHFTFKAFLFRGQRANEPLIVTAKVQACQERDDCDFTDCSETRDDGRYKRSIEESSSSKNTSMDWNTQLALRVVGLNDDLSMDYNLNEFSNDPPLQTPTASFQCADKMVFSALIGSFVAVVLSMLTFTLMSFCGRKRQIKAKLENTSASADKRQLQRSASNTTNSDFVRYSSGIQNHGNKSSKISSPSAHDQAQFPVAKLLQELSDDGGDYRRAEHQTDDDGVYVVYYKRSRSVPGSLREKLPSKRSAMTDLEDSDDDTWNATLGRSRQTVRSVKKRSQRRQKIRNRKGIPSDYRRSTDSLVSAPRNRGSTTSIHIGSQEETLAAPFRQSTQFQNTNSAGTHVVTRSDTSTQIIIIPETNV